MNEKKKNTLKSGTYIIANLTSMQKSQEESPLLPLHSVTYEGGKMIDRKGNVYLGRDCEDVNEKGFSNIEEVECILEQIEEDRLKGVSLTIIKRRSSFLWFLIAKSTKGELAHLKSKIDAIEIVNVYRRSLGWSEKKHIKEYIDKVRE
jgi:hypothetical protein